MPREGESIKIKYNRGRRSTVCYSEGSLEEGENNDGWCGVCLKNAKPYSYGYCSYDGPPPREDQFITRVRRAKHWGFCSDRCNTNSDSHNLKETKLTVLTIDDCVRFNSSRLLYRDDGELCAGSKTPYPVMKVYTRKKLRKSLSSGKKYIFIHTEDETNTVMYFA